MRLREGFELRLVLRVLQILRHVVEKKGKAGNAQLADAREFVGQYLEIPIAGVSHGEARTDGKTEIHKVVLRGLDQFTQSLLRFRRVGVAPELAMVGIVFGGVVVHVHAMRPLKTQNVDAVLMRPGSAVKTFHHAALREGGEIHDDGGEAISFDAHGLRVGNQLARKIRRRESPTNPEPAARHCEIPARWWP